MSVDPETRVEVSVIVRPRRPLDQVRPGAEPLSREAFAAEFGADAADLAKVEAFARSHGLEVIEADAARRTVRLAGRAADMSAAFGVALRQQGNYRVVEGEPRLPPELRDIVVGVFGLDTRPVARRR
jgi:kumamolisin